jgi:hypothetical protein
LPSHDRGSAGADPRSRRPLSPRASRRCRRAPTSRSPARSSSTQKRTAFRRLVVAGYVGYIFNNEKAIAKKSGFIALTDRQLPKACYQYLQALKANNT